MPRAIRCRPMLLSGLLPLLLGGCITFRTIDDGIARARLGELTKAGPVTVQPETMVEDSRCPEGTTCIRAGTVRLAVRIDGAPVELTLAQPAALPGGTLTLVEAYPAPRTGVTRYPDEYRFGFRWDRVDQPVTR